MKKAIHLGLLLLFLGYFQTKAQIQLQNPELALSLIASDSTRAKQFYQTCLGLTHQNTLTAPGLKMFLYRTGQAAVKVRVYAADPPPQDPDLTAANGLRFITIPVQNFDTVLARLAAHAFPAPLVRIQNSVRTALAKDGDGNVVEMLDASTAPGRKLEMGILVSDADSLDYFYQNILGLPEAPAVAGPSPVEGAVEYRYKANNTVLRLFELPGSRPSDVNLVNGAQGYRYITFTLSADVDILHKTMQDKGLDIAVPFGPFGQVAYLFMVRGPGGALHEFLGPLHVEEPGTAFTDMVFTADYYAPGLPPDEAIAKTLEANALEVHEGKIYCATTYGGPNGVPSTSDPKILVKDSADGSWRIDYQGGNKFVRFPILKSVHFTSDANGNDLPQPVPVLVAGTGAWRSWNPDGVYVISRNDVSGAWVESKLSEQCWNIADANKGCEVRAIFDHRDKVTGVHYVFAGAYNGALYRGWYNPQMPGLIEWDPVPEIDSLLGHVLCAATVGDTLYIGMSFGEASGEPFVWRPYKDYGLWKRVDGDRQPVVGHDYDPNDDLQWRWIEIPEWEDPLNPGEHTRKGQFRGLSAIPDPNGGKHQVLAFHWDSPDSVIELVDPADNYKNTVELGTKSFVQDEWGSSAFCITVGYNDWCPAVHPETNDSVHLIGAWAQYPGGETGSPEGKSSWLFVRYPNATYNIVRIWDENNPLTNATNGLKGCRSIKPSPFPEEAGHVWYFCGFDLTGQGTSSVVGNKAWIYKGTVGNLPSSVPDVQLDVDRIALYPNPAGDVLYLTGLPADFSGTIAVYNSMGQVVADGWKSGGRFSVETGHLQPGIYVLQLRAPNGSTTSRKFVKQ